MTKEEVQNFSMRITQASRSELVVIMYEVILCDIKSAKEALQAENREEFEKSLMHAGRFVNELMASLNFSISLSYRLMSLYIYAHRQITMAKAKKSEELLNVVTGIFEKLLVGYQKVSEEDMTGPMMQNTQQVYAGLTYGKGYLNEMYVNGNEAKRGYIA